jgi:hypothetical protein
MPSINDKMNSVNTIIISAMYTYAVILMIIFMCYGFLVVGY